MAKFTKLNIGDAVASSGGRVWKKLSSMLQLSAPTLSLDGDMLTITDDSKLATSFDILVDGEVKASVEVVTDTVVTAYFKKQSSSTPNIEIGYYSEDDYETHPLATITSTAATEITLTYPSGTLLYLSAIDFSNTFWYITVDGETIVDGELVEPLYDFEVENGKTYTIHAEED